MFLQKLKHILTKPIFKFQINYGFFNPAKWNWQKFKEFIKIFLLTASLVLVFLLSYDIFINDLVPADDQLAIDISDQIISYLDENNTGGVQSEDANCNAKGINLHGFLIGVTMSYLDNYKKNLKDGLTFNSLSTGKFKDTGNSDKPLTNEERALIMRDLNITNEHFIKSVAVNRKLDIKKVRKLADGSSMPGELALQNGLIDKIGGIYEIKDYLKEKIDEDVVVCW